MSAHIGVTGLAVMGANLARNLARNGYTVALHNRSAAKTDALLQAHGDEASSSGPRPWPSWSSPWSGRAGC